MVAGRVIDAYIAPMLVASLRSRLSSNNGENISGDKIIDIMKGNKKEIMNCYDDHALTFSLSCFAG